MRRPSPARPARALGFTLIELLVTIIIIVVLIGILIPTVSKVRSSAQAAVTKQQIASIMGAIERFHQEQGHYPGPLNENDLEAGIKGCTPPNIQNVLDANGANGNPKITSSENLLLGLVGGLKWVTTGNQTQLTFDRNMVGKGMVSMNPGQPKKYQPYLELPSAQISQGHYADNAFPQGADDTNIPEILDTFPNPMPILYLRARVGAGGIILDDRNQWAPNGSGPGVQYYLTDMLAYTSLPIGEGKRIRPSDYVNVTTPPGNALPHGLQSVQINGASTIHKSENGQTINGKQMTYFYPYDAYGYFVSPSDPARTTPRSKDTFILISAGVDRIYGTDDDICSFGDLKP